MRTVLLVDDNEMLRRLAAKNLELELPKLHAAGASTCEEARRLLKELAPDVVVLDHVLSDGTGLDLMTEVAPTAKDTAFVVVSADTGPALRHRAMTAGAFAVLPKPIETDALVEVVEQALQHSGERRPSPELAAGPVPPAEVSRELVERVHHRAVNRLTTLVAGLRALEADLQQATPEGSAVREVLDGYLDGLLKAAADVSKMLQELLSSGEESR